MIEKISNLLDISKFLDFFELLDMFLIEFS
jgi:hypothetical protein